MKNNILEQANEIVNKRSEEKERMYGPFEESMEKAAKLASLMTNKHIETKFAITIKFLDQVINSIE